MTGVINEVTTQAVTRLASVVLLPVVSRLLLLFVIYVTFYRRENHEFAFC